MPWARVTPVLLECTPGSLCAKRYPGHTKGCPNFGKRSTCPPQADLWTPEYFANKTAYAVWNQFHFGEHVERMRARHPGWTQRQLANCLYWQGTARKQLTREIQDFTTWLEDVRSGITVLCVNRIPEAHGLNVTMTMASNGILLEWPPREWAYQVALAVTITGGGE